MNAGTFSHEGEQSLHGCVVTRTRSQAFALKFFFLTGLAEYLFDVIVCCATLTLVVFHLSVCAFLKAAKPFRALLVVMKHVLYPSFLAFLPATARDNTLMNKVILYLPSLFALFFVSF